MGLPASKFVIIQSLHVVSQGTFQLDVNQHFHTLDESEKFLESWHDFTFADVNFSKFFASPIEYSLVVHSVKLQLAVTAAMKNHRDVIFAEPDIKLNPLKFVINCTSKPLHRVFWAEESSTVSKHKSWEIRKFLFEALRFRGLEAALCR
jgi:hypothetical protein